MGENLSDRPKIPAPRIDFEAEVQEFARRTGANFIVSGAEFGPMLPLNAEVIKRRAEAARERLGLRQSDDQKV